MNTDLRGVSLAVYLSWRRLGFWAAYITLATLAFYIVPEEWRGVALAVMVGSLPGAAWLVLNLRDADNRARQRFRDEAAARILNDPKGIGSRSFFLYLRPFKSTGGVRVLKRVVVRRRRMTDIAIRGPGDVWRSDIEWDDLETLLAGILDPIGPLIGLGRPGEQLGAGRISVSDAEWRVRVRALSDRAMLIFMLPSNDPGTKWEFDYVMAEPHILRKTVFVVPGLEDVEAIVGSCGTSGRRLIEDLARDHLHAKNPGASQKPVRSAGELREGALSALRAAAVNIRRASSSPLGTLVMLDAERKIREFIALTGRVALLVRLGDASQAFRLSVPPLRRWVRRLARQGLSRTAHS